MSSSFASNFRAFICRTMLASAFSLLALNAVYAQDPLESVSYRREVVPLLTKLGCNSGPCHGNLTGKGGLKLSLRGEDPRADWLTLTHDAQGRRLSLNQPDSSLLLAKPAGLLPHEGGIKFRPDDAIYRKLQAWVAQGALDDQSTGPELVSLKVAPELAWLEHNQPRSVDMKVLAQWSDGTTSDVTALSGFDINDPSGASIGPSGQFQAQRPGEWVVGVRYLNRHGVSRLIFLEDHPGFAWPNNLPERTRLDTAVFAKLKRLKHRPSAEAAPQPLLRRLYLDLLGVLPTPDEIKAYEQEKSPGKYEKLVDTLLARPEFSDLWALRWSDLLRNEPKVMGSKGNWQFHRWLTEQFAQDRPLDQMASELITTTGSSWSAPASAFHRTNRDPATAAETFAQVFLGYRFQCAKCHNHPSDIWTQNDYYGLAASFANLRRKDINNIRRDRFDKHEVNGDVVIYFTGPPTIVQPRSGRELIAKPPGAQPLSENEQQPEAALRHLADWLTTDNRQFARNLANRVWFHLMGKGVVDPVDDFRDSNPPSNPELLDELELAFRQGGYRLRPLARYIVTSTVYRLESEPASEYPATEADFGRSAVRLLPAEVLRDIVDQATGYQRPSQLGPKGQRASQIAAANTRGEEFMKVFGKPERLLSCECERSEETTLAQAFQLINGETVRDAIEADDNRISHLMKRAAADPNGAISELFLATLSRRPTDVEISRLTNYLASAKNQRKAWEDVVWATLNAKEFLFRH